MTHQESCDAMLLLAPRTTKLLRYYRDADGIVWFVKAWFPGGVRLTFTTLAGIRDHLVGKHMIAVSHKPD